MRTLYTGSPHTSVHHSPINTFLGFTKPIPLTVGSIRLDRSIKPNQIDLTDLSHQCSDTNTYVSQIQDLNERAGVP